MTKFTFVAEEDGVKSTIEFEGDVWLDAFPQFLNLMKSSGFYINHGSALYVPGISEHLFKNDDRDYLLFDSDLADLTELHNRVEKSISQSTIENVAVNVQHQRNVMIQALGKEGNI